MFMLICFSEKAKDESKDKNGSKQGNGKTNDKDAKKMEFEWQTDWGEQLVGVRNPRIFVLNIKEQHLTMLPGIPDKISAGQVSFHTFVC